MRLSKFRKLNQSPSKGEVFTPKELVQEMLSKLPIELFISTTTTFLIPSVREGTFIKEVVKKLMKYGHSRENAVSRVIGIDRRSKYVNPLKRVGYRVYKEDLLNPSKEFKNIMSKKFDAILGNPPFQGKTGYKGLGTLWPLFIKKSLNLLKKNSHLMFITPPSWMSPGGDLFELFKENNLKYVNLNCNNWFNVSSDFSYWLLNNKDYDGNTAIKTSEDVNSVDISRLPYLPIDINRNTFSILEKTILSDVPKLDTKINSECHSQRNEIVSYEKTEEYKFPVKHTNSNNTYSTVKHSNFDIKKVMYCLTGNFDPVYRDGEIGTGQNTVWVEVQSKSEADNLIWYLKNSKLIKFVLRVCKWSGSGTRGIYLNSFPMIDLSIPMNDRDLYELFDLSEDEIEYIENYVD